MSTEHQSGNTQLQNAFDALGLTNFEKITNTLQGSIWRSFHSTTKNQVVVKITNRKLHEQSSTLIKGERYIISENIIKEKQILNYLSCGANVPNSLVKYVGFFKSASNYYLIMTDGGCSLFDFAVKAHKIISAQRMSIINWQKCVQIILKQIVEAVEYIHSKSICHFDISLENILINDVDVDVMENGSIRINPEGIQCKICDFGLAESFENKKDFKCQKFCGKHYYKSPELNKKEIFDAKKNDIFCIAVSLFILLTGGAPWNKAIDSDKNYIKMMGKNGIKNSLRDWNKLQYVNDDIVELLEMIFKLEDERASLDKIKRCKFLEN